MLGLSNIDYQDLKEEAEQKRKESNRGVFHVKTGPYPLCESHY